MANGLGRKKLFPKNFEKYFYPAVIFQHKKQKEYPAVFL
jgi:hypothetical protein